MEWTDKKNRTSVIALQSRYGPKYNLKILHTLDIGQMFKYRGIDRYNETSSVCDKKRSGPPRSVRTKRAIKAIRERMRRILLRKQKILSREMKIAPKFIF